MPTLEDAVQHIRMGNKAEGRTLLEELLDIDENNEEIWLWLSTVVDANEDREICLENVLALDPDNVLAKRGIEALRSGIFDPDDMLLDLMDDGSAPVSDEPPATFLDDFVIGDDDFVDDDDLLLPGEAKKRSKKRKGGGINVRLVILGVLGVILVMVLGGLAVVSVFFVGDDGGNGDQAATAESPPSQQAPAQDQTEPTATPTDNPTPASTDTPAPTPTAKLQLPTARPTDLPTPTATQVVSPTPIR